MAILEDIGLSLQEGDEEKASEAVRQALAQGLGAKEILDKGLLAGMDALGAKFREREVFLPDVLLAAKAMYAGLEHLRPLLGGQAGSSSGKVVLGTVQGDLHDIGKNLVSILLRGAGIEVVDLGKDVAPEAFVDAAVREGASLIGMSALLTTTMPMMKDVVELIRSRGLSGRVRTIVGGAPVSAEYAREIGADFYAFDAANAVERVKAALSGRGEQPPSKDGGPWAAALGD